MSADRKVLAQDLPQYQESLRIGETARRNEIEAQNAEIERQNKEAEEKYQRELEAYKKAQEKQKTEKQKIEEDYNKQLAEIQRQKTEAIIAKEEELKNANISRSQRASVLNEIEKQYDRKINEVERTKQTIILPMTLREEGYPEYVVTKTTRAFAKGTYDTPTFAISMAEKLFTAKQASAERDRETSIQQTVNAPRYTREQTYLIEKGRTTSIRGSNPQLEAAEKRAEQIKETTPPAETIFPYTPKMVEDRNTLTNVKTGEYIYGGYFLANNPRALVQSITKPQIAEGVKIRKSEEAQPIEEKSNIEILKDTLSRYSAVTTPQKAPFASVLEASLTDRGRKVGVMEKLFIEKSAYKQYKTRAESFGLTEAKGKQATYKFGEREFSAETGMGDVTIGRQLGFVFDYNLQRPTIEYPKTFEGSLSYVVSPKVQGPQKPKEETVIAVPGSLEYALGEQRKETGFNKLVETQYNKLGEMQEVVKKRGNILEQLAYAPSEIVRSGLGTMAMVVNVSEQYVDPFVQKSLGLKQTIKPRPIELKSDVSGTVILPYQFEKGRFDYSPKEWASRQAQFIEKKGVPAYALGVGFDYFGLVGTPSLIRGGIKAIPKLSSKLSAPVKKEAGKILEKRISFMLDSGKQKTFSYDIPYSPTKRANEIDITDFGERIGPSTPLTKKPVAAKQSDVIPFTKEKTKPVQTAPYKPRGRYEGGFGDLYSDKGEVVGKYSSLSQKPVAAKQSDIILPTLKKEKPVPLDPFYKPAKRPNEIDLTRDDILATFTTTKVKLGKAIPRPSKTKLKGKQVKPVEEDFFYKPAKRPNEIDYTDFADKIKMPKIEPEKSEISLSLKRELERLKRKKPEFKQEKIEFGGQGTEIKSGSQILLTLQKQEKLTKKKLKTQRQTPISIDWSEKIETSEIPKTGNAPLKTVLVPIKETKKKPYLKEKTDAIQSYEIQLSEQRPMIKTIPKTSFSFAQPQRIQEAIRYSQPQRLQTSQPQKLRERSRLKEVAKLTSIQISTPKVKQIQRTSPKLATPLEPKMPTRLAQPQAPKIRQKTTQIFRYRYPKEPPRKLKFAILPPPEDKVPESVKKKASEKADFLGNVSEVQISGIFGKRSETVYGQKKIGRLLKGDVRVIEGKKRTVRVSKKKFDLMGFKKGKSKTSFW